MKLIEIIKKLFTKESDYTVGELMAKADSTTYTVTIGERTFKRLWRVSDIDNGFKTIKEGFTTKAEAKAYCETVSFNWYLTPYDEEI